MKEYDILDAAAKVLATVRDIPVVLDHEEEGIESPRFFASLIDVASQSNLRLIYHDCTLHITYFAPRGQTDTEELYAIKDGVKDAFVSGMTVGDRYIKFTSVSAEIAGEDADIIYFDLPFVYYENIPEDTPKWLIEHIYDHGHNMNY